jgi:hypothetical protein
MIERRYIDKAEEKETAINIQYVGNIVYSIVQYALTMEKGSKRGKK